MSIDEQHVALPKLYGAPAYARPAPVVATTPRPFDPDDLPIEAFQTEDERELASGLPVRSWAAGGAPMTDAGNGHGGGTGTGTGAGPDDPGLRPRPLSLKSIAGRLLGGD